MTFRAVSFKIKNYLLLEFSGILVPAKAKLKQKSQRLPAARFSAGNRLSAGGLDKLT
jgi:hypothetical protein